MWVGAGQAGLNRLDPATGRWQRFRHNAADPNSLSDDTIRFIAQDRAGTLWIGTADGLNRYEAGGDRFISYHSSPRDPTSLGADHLLSFLEDRAGLLYFGTYGGGISKLDRSANRFTLYRHDPFDANSLSNNQVRAFAEDQAGNLWVGTDGGGLNRFERAQDRVTHYRRNPDDAGSLTGDRVRALAVDRDGVLWVGLYGGGLDRFDPLNQRFSHYRHDPADPASLGSNTVTALQEAADGTLWVGTDGGGISVLAAGRDRFTRYDAGDASRHGLASNAIRALRRDRADGMWIGTANAGVYHWTPAQSRFTHYPVGGPAGLPVPVALSIHEDRRGTVWVGTFGGGLCKLDVAQAAFTCYTEEDGLPNDVVYGILEDDLGGLWLSTNRGISHFTPETLSFVNYTAADGLQSNEFNGGAYFQAARTGGEMFFGGINGFTVFRPQDVRQKNAFIPPIVLTSFTPGSQPIHANDLAPAAAGVKLQWPENYFHFEFAALSYARPEKNQYAYKLEGFRAEDWNYIGTQRFGRYTNLPGGEYRLRLKAANSDGVWNEEGIAIPITVVPPVWERWWFRALAGLLLVGVIAAGYTWRVRDVEARSRALAIQVSERTREIEARRQDLSALFQADEELHGHLHLDRVLDALVKISVEVLNADKSAVLTWDRGHERLSVRMARGFDPNSLAGLSFACGQGLAARVAESGRPAVVENAPQDPLLADEPEAALRALAAEGVRSLLHLPIIVGEQVFGVFCVAYCRAHAFDADQQRLFTALAHRAAQAIENARLFEAERDRVTQLTALQETTRAVASTLEQDALLKQIIQQATSLLHGDGGLINLVDWDKREDEVVAATGVADHLVGARGSLDGSLSGWITLHNQPVVSSQLDTDSRVDRTALGWLKLRNIESVVAAPLAVKEQVVGTLVVLLAGSAKGTFQQADLELLVAFANQAAVAIENARLYEQAQRLAVVEERGRIARDLHDAVTQTLFSASLIAEALPAIWANDRREGEQLLQELRQLSRGALAEMRTLLLELRPAALMEADLGDVLRQLAEAAAGRAGAKVNVQTACRGRGKLPGDVHVALYRIAQEALNNVVKHARATEVNVTLTRWAESAPAGAGAVEAGPAHAELIVADDGRGFTVDEAPPDHLGLGIIRERAQAIGAQLEIESTPGRGTRVSVRWAG